jgi:predicted aspartyl protease
MTTRRGVVSGLGWLVGLGALGWVARERLLPPDLNFEGEATSSGPLPFASRRTDLPVVLVGVNGATVPALIDSGADHSVVDAAFAEERGLPNAWTPPTIAYGVGGGPQVGRGVALDLRLGNLRLRRLKAVALGLGPIAQAAGLGVPLVLGQDLLSGLIADFEFPRRRVTLHRRAGWSPPPGAVSADARRQGRGLHVRVALEGRPIEVLLDTGASSALALSRTTAETAGLLDGREAQPTSSVVLGGVAQGARVEARTLAFAGQTLRDVGVDVFEAARVPGFPSGMLGVEALRRRRAILDLGGGKLHLLPVPARPQRRRSA